MPRCSARRWARTVLSLEESCSGSKQAEDPFRADSAHAERGRYRAVDAAGHRDNEAAPRKLAREDFTQAPRDALYFGRQDPDSARRGKVAMLIHARSAR